jgi:DNA-binding phage protein
MKARPQIKHPNKNQQSLMVNNFSPQMKLFHIAIQMKKTGLSDTFIVNAVRTALEFEDVADLMTLWINEQEKAEQAEIIADIQDMIDACTQTAKAHDMYVQFNDLPAIAQNIRAFKDSLYQLVMERGGINQLSQLTGIPQPSLSRFFSSNALPRRVTVLKIAKALNLDKIKIDPLWNE